MGAGGRGKQSAVTHADANSHKEGGGGAIEFRPTRDAGARKGSGAWL